VFLSDLDALIGILIFSRNSLRDFHDGFALFIRQDEERRRGERPTWLPALFSIDEHNELIVADDKMKQLLGWLCPVNIERHHASTSAIQQPETTVWFTDGEALHKLVAGEYKVLWINGRRTYYQFPTHCCWLTCVTR